MLFCLQHTLVIPEAGPHGSRHIFLVRRSWSRTIKVERVLRFIDCIQFIFVLVQSWWCTFIKNNTNYLKRTEKIEKNKFLWDWEELVCIYYLRACRGKLTELKIQFYKYIKNWKFCWAELFANAGRVVMAETVKQSGCFSPNAEFFAQNLWNSQCHRGLSRHERPSRREALSSKAGGAGSGQCRQGWSRCSSRKLGKWTFIIS